VEVISGNPYVDDGNIRTFDIKQPATDYVWHRDQEDRTIKCIEGEGWQFQLQKCLPWLLKPGMIFDISKLEYHRLIKGATPLKCRVYKYVNSQ
jgi:hypothetical protein